MITTKIRILLLIVASVSFAYMMHQIRKSRLLIRESLFWFFFSALLILMAVFPHLISSMSHFFGIDTPANFVFLFIIALLITRIFKMTIQVSVLNERIDELTRVIAIRETDAGKKKNEGMKRNRFRSQEQIPDSRSQ